VEKTIFQYIDAIATKVELPKEIISLSNGVNMTYNYLTDEISFDARRIAHILNHYPHISLKDYVTTFTLHELGHSLDRDNLLQSYDQTVEWYKLANRLTTEEKETNLRFLELSYLEAEADLHFEHVAWSHAIRLNEIYHLVSETVLDQLQDDSLLTYEDNYEYSKDLFEASKKIPTLP